MTDEPDINKEVWDRLWALWEKLDRPASYDIPVDALTLAGIGPQDYNEWRLAIEDEKRREQELLADAAGADARDAGLREQGMEPMPPRRTPEEVAAVEQREQEAEERERKRREREGQAEWLPEDEAG
jgi:hypothetical protein